jgi:transcriptional regulator with GAF, ATPase, and Fis domain
VATDKPLAAITPFAAPALPARARRGDDDARLRHELEALLREHGGNISAVARATRKTRFQVRRWIKRFGFDISKLGDGNATS